MFTRIAICLLLVSVLACADDERAPVAPGQCDGEDAGPDGCEGSASRVGQLSQSLTGQCTYANRVTNYPIGVDQNKWMQPLQCRTQMYWQSGNNFNGNASPWRATLLNPGGGPTYYSTKESGTSNGREAWRIEEPGLFGPQIAYCWTSVADTGTTRVWNCGLTKYQDSSMTSQCTITGRVFNGTGNIRNCK